MFRFAVMLSLFSLTMVANGDDAVSLPTDISLKGVAMKLIPAGEFVMGSDKVEKQGLQSEYGSIKAWYMDEHPMHKEKSDAYYIGQYEVTNMQYREFVKEAHYLPPSDWIESGYVVTMKREVLNELSVVKLRTIATDRLHIDVDTREFNKQQLLDVIDKYFTSIDQLPVRNVSWFDAYKFCEWDGANLPTEVQWERANRGDAGNEFPWGNEFEPGLSNAGDEDWPLGTAPVGSYKKDKSPFEIYDMAGNVSEWVSDWYNPYAGSDFSSEMFGEKYKVIRGAGWGRNGHYALELYQRAAYRHYLSPDDEHQDVGFRCAVDAKTAVKQMAQASH